MGRTWAGFTAFSLIVEKYHSVKAAWIRNVLLLVAYILLSQSKGRDPDFAIKVFYRG